MFVWWYILFSLIVVVATGIFLPDGISGGVKNLPYLFILLSILVIALSIKLFKYLRFFWTAKKHLKKNGYQLIYCSCLPFLLRKEKEYNILAKKGEGLVKILIINVKKSYLTYHFEGINKIEFYKSTRLTIKPDVRQANIISPTVTTQKVGEKTLFWSENEAENEKRILLFNRFPNLVKDAMHSEGLGNGDKIMSEIYIYNLDGFLRKVN